MPQKSAKILDKDRSMPQKGAKDARGAKIKDKDRAIPRQIIAILVVLFAFASIAFTSTEALVKSPPQRAILPNGLKIIAVEDRSLPIIGAILMFNVGQGCGFPVEPAYLPLSMIVREKADTEQSTRFQVNEKVEKHGVQEFYSQSTLKTFFGCQGPSESLDVMFDFLHSVGFRLKPTQEVLDSSKEVLLRGIKDCQRFPLSSGYLFDGANSILFSGSPMATSLLGTPENLAGISLGKLTQFNSDFFVPNNAVLVVVGDIDPSSVFKKAMGQFGQLTAKNIPVLASAPEPVVKDEKKENREFMDVKTTQVMIAFEAPSLKDPDRPAAELWTTALSDSNDSWLNQNLEKKFPGIRKVRANYRSFSKSGVISIGFESEDPEIDRVVSYLLEGLSNLYLDPPRNERLQRLVVAKRSRNNLDNEMRIHQAIDLAYAELTKDFALCSGLNPAMERVSSDDMERVAKRIFSTQRYAIKIVHPLTCQITGEAKAREESLGNGLKLVVKPYSGSEVAGVNFLFSVGLPSETPGKEGISALLAFYLEESCQGGKADMGSLGRQLDDLGAGISVVWNLDLISITAFVEKEKLPDLLRILNQGIFQPKWDRETLKTTASNLMNQSNSQKEVPGKVLLNSFIGAAYSGIPISRGTLTPDSVKDYSIDDLRDFHSRWMIPSLAQCTIIGNFDPSKTFDEAKKILGEIPSGNKTEVVKTPENFSEPLSASKELDVFMSCPKDSAFLTVGYRLPGLPKLLGSEATRPDFVSNMVVFHLLTWSSNGIIQREMIDKGLAHDIVWNQLISTADISFCIFTLRVPFSKLNESKAALKKIIEGISGRSISPDDILTAGKVLNSYFMMGMEKSSNQAATISSFQRVGMGLDFADEISKMYRSISPEKVQSAAKKYFSNFILITGKPN